MKAQVSRSMVRHRVSGRVARTVRRVARPVSGEVRAHDGLPGIRCLLWEVRLPGRAAARAPGMAKPHLR